MPVRLKNILVDSFIGAIAIAWMLAEAVERFAAALSNPLSRWLAERVSVQSLPGFVAPSVRFPWEMAIPTLIAAAVQLLIAFLLLRWLYWPEEDKGDEAVAPAPEA